jgi:hypothetical protein
MIVAGRLAPKRYLIGPNLFPIYAFVLKMVLLWIIVPVFVFIVGPATLATHNGALGTAIGMTIGNLWSALFIAAGTITLVFVVIERTAATAKGECKWDPFKLPPIRKQERRTSLFEVVCDLSFNFVGLIWLLLIPQNHFLILGPAASFLKPGPIWHTYYWAIVAGAIFGMARCVVALAEPRWTWLPALGSLLQNAFTMIVLKFMLDAAGHTGSGAWHPFVVVQQTMTTAESIRTSAIVNVSILLSLLGMWVGLAIALPIQTWKLIRRIRGNDSTRPQSATVHAT